jgi:hypothetical protein
MRGSVEKMDRREFLKSTAAAGLLALLPFSVPDETIVIVDYELEEGWQTAIKFDKWTRHKDSIGVECSADMDEFWGYLTLIDDGGNHWHTSDQGHTWNHGDKSFNMDGEVWQA